MYGNHHCVTMMGMMPISVGALYAISWIAMAAVTLLFLTGSLIQLARPNRGLTP
jgi:hypothetical protein